MPEVGSEGMAPRDAIEGQSTDKSERIDVRSLRGDLHVHNSEDSSDGQLPLEAIARYYDNLGLEYFAITNHYSPGSFQDERERIAAISEGLEVRMIAGTEVDIAEDGSVTAIGKDLALSEFTIASIHVDKEGQPSQKSTERSLLAIQNPMVDVLGHPGRDAEKGDLDWKAICMEAKSLGKAIEININKIHRLMSGKEISDGKTFLETIETFDVVALQEIADSGVLVSIGSDLHKNQKIEDERLVGNNWRQIIEVVNQLSLFGITRERVINTWDLEQVTEWVKSHREQATNDSKIL